MSFYLCAHLKDVEQGPDFQLTAWLCRNKFVAKRLKAGQRAKYLTQARGCKEFWSWAALVWVRGSEGDSGRKGSQHLPSAFAFPLFSSITADPGDCLAADAARSLQWCIPVGAAASFPGQWGAGLGCWGTWHAGGKDHLRPLPQALHHKNDLKPLSSFWQSQQWKSLFY